MKKRDDLRLIISSATINVKEFLDYFETNTDKSNPSLNTAIAITVPGKTYTVETFYTEISITDYLSASVETVIELLRKEQGDILVFLTGQEEVEEAIRRTKELIYEMYFR